ncbi:hypothetical protein ACL02T_27325 [Pseudonocardia sp. RS010]|uniref:hypothetical protein n=1 Tax=Pseudonocardia sp. RS010 TaxID=3385979 RepID=UPI00399F714F
MPGGDRPRAVTPFYDQYRRPVRSGEIAPVMTAAILASRTAGSPSTAAPAGTWFDAMRELHRDLPVVDLPDPAPALLRGRIDR